MSSNFDALFHLAFIPLYFLLEHYESLINGIHIYVEVAEKVWYKKENVIDWIIRKEYKAIETSSCA